MANLLEQLRATGEEILDAALPTPQELPKIIAALTAHLEQNVPNIERIALDALEHRKEPEPAEGVAPAAATPIASEPAASETPEQLKARLEAELANANAQAPAVTSEAAPPAP